MMMNGDKKRLMRLLVVLAVVLCWAAVISFGYMRAKRASAMTARGDLEATNQLAGKIKALSQRPSLASEFERHAAETSGLIERAAAAAGLPQGSLVRITPEPPQRLEDTVYKEKPIRVTVKKATLRQVTQLLYQVTAGSAAGEGLRAKAVRLQTSRGDAPTDAWDAEIVVSYLIYDPPHAENIK